MIQMNYEKQETFSSKNPKKKTIINQLTHLSTANEREFDACVR